MAETIVFLLVSLFLLSLFALPILIKEYGISKNSKFRWKTSYYKIRNKSYIHIFPDSTIHIEDEYGTCPCHPREQDFEKDVIVYTHNKLNKSSK